MAILTKSEAELLLKKILALSKADQCEVNISGSVTGNLRYARNAVSTSGAISQSTIEVYSAFGKKLGIATINEYDDASLEKVVRRSEELAMLAPENPEFMNFLGPRTFTESESFVPATAAITPKDRADAVGESLRVATEKQVSAAGFLENYNGFSAMMNSKGLFAYDKDTNVNFSVTLRTADGRGSGYATKGYNDVKQLDVAAATAVGVEKALKSAEARAIEPGKYTVILEPAAVAVLLENLIYDFDGRSADEGRSSMSKPGGKTKQNEKLVDERVNIYSDPHYPLLPTRTWAGDGRPQEKVSWIDKGVVKNFYYSRYWADKKGVKAVPFPDGMVMDGGTSSLEELIKGTGKGILVTRLWYIRTVDPQTLLLTGLTRDGTFYIENGVIKFPIKNFRFNESPIIMLNNLEALGKTERTVSGESFNHYVLPPMKIREFTFSSLSDAV